jgi:hypothetical protein
VRLGSLPWFLKLKDMPCWWWTNRVRIFSGNNTIHLSEDFSP